MAVDELASHNHSYIDIPKTWLQVDYSKDDVANFNESARKASKGITYTTNSAGGNQAHNNIQPVMAAYAWRRQA